jgi:hypothetical protein
MSAWDEELIDKEEEGYFEFDQRDNGCSISATFTATWTSA